MLLVLNLTILIVENAPVPRTQDLTRSVWRKRELVPARLFSNLASSQENISHINFVICNDCSSFLFFLWVGGSNLSFVEKFYRPSNHNSIKVPKVFVLTNKIRCFSNFGYHYHLYSIHLWLHYNHQNTVHIFPIMKYFFKSGTKKKSRNPWETEL